MDNALAGYGVMGTIVLTMLALLIAVLWVCMPFAIFGTKPLLRELIAEQRKTNKLLQAQADRAQAIRDAASKLSHSGVQS